MLLNVSVVSLAAVYPAAISLSVPASGLQIAKVVAEVHYPIVPGAPHASVLIDPYIGPLVERYTGKAYFKRAEHTARYRARYPIRLFDTRQRGANGADRRVPASNLY